MVDEGTFDIVEKSGGYFYVTFHGYDYKRRLAARGVARTTDFQHWDTRGGDLPGDAIFAAADCQGWGGGKENHSRPHLEHASTSSVKILRNGSWGPLKFCTTTTTPVDFEIACIDPRSWSRLTIHPHSPCGHPTARTGLRPTHVSELIATLKYLNVMSCRCLGGTDLHPEKGAEQGTPGHRRGTHVLWRRTRGTE